GFAMTQDGREVDDLAMAYYRLKLKSQISDRLTLKLLGAHTRSDNNGPRTELAGINPDGYALQQAAAELAGINSWHPGEDPQTDAELHAFIPAALAQYSQWIDDDYSTIAA